MVAPTRKKLSLPLALRVVLVAAPSAPLAVPAVPVVVVAAAIALGGCEGCDDGSPPDAVDTPPFD